MNFINKYKCLYVAFIINFCLIGSVFGKSLGDGKIAIYNYHENEFAEIEYRRNGKYLNDGMKKIKVLFRSRDKKELQINLKLIELIDDIQDHFGAETVELISGYRSPNYNKSLKMFGKNVAKESYHMKGMAADIHIDEITEEEIYEYAKSLKTGGVGIYPIFDFVHVDVGPVRTWKGTTEKKRILVGTENNPSELWSAVTDKNNYHRGDEILSSVKNNGYDKQRVKFNHVWLEHFRNGKWAEHNKIKVNGKGAKLKAGETTDFLWKVDSDALYGKYRFVIFPTKAEKPMYSNEFYIKKI